MFRIGVIVLGLCAAVPASATTQYDFYKQSCDSGFAWGCYEWESAARPKSWEIVTVPPVIAAFDPFAQAIAAQVRGIHSWPLLTLDRERVAANHLEAARLRTCEHDVPVKCNQLERLYQQSGNFGAARRLTETLCTHGEFWWERARACRLYGYELLDDNQFGKAFRVLIKSCRDREVESCLFLGFYFRRHNANDLERYAFKLGCRLGNHYACVSAKRRPASAKREGKPPTIFQYGSHRIKELFPTTKTPSKLMFSAPPK